MRKRKKKIKYRFVFITIISVIIVLSIVWLCIPKVSRNEKKCSAAIQKELRKGNVDKANDLFFGFKEPAIRLNNGVVKSLASVNIEKGNVKEVIAIEGAIPDSYVLNREIAGILFDYFLGQGEYEKAWEYREGKIVEGVYVSTQEALMLENIIKDMLCKKNGKEETRRFFSYHITQIRESDNCEDEKILREVKKIENDITNYINRY